MEHLASAALWPNQAEMETTDTSQIWTPDSRELVERDIVYPTTYSTIQEEGSQAKRAALRAHIVHGLPENVAELGDRVAEIDIGKRHSEHQTHFSSVRLASLNGLAATDVPDSERIVPEQMLRLLLGDDELVDRLYDGTATIPDHLTTYQSAHALGAEIGRAVMPLGYGHQNLPTFYRGVRDGIMEFDPDARLYPPILEKLVPVDIAGHFDDETGEFVIDAIAFRARLDHGALSDGSAVRAREIFLLSLRSDAAMASNNEAYQEMTRNITRQVVEAKRAGKVWQDELLENPDPLLAIMVEDYLQDEYQERPAAEVPAIDWIRRLESTFYVTHPERQAAYDQRIAEDITAVEQQEKREHIWNTILYGPVGGDIAYNNVPNREDFAYYAHTVGSTVVPHVVERVRRTPRAVVDRILQWLFSGSGVRGLEADVDTERREEADERSDHEDGVLDFAVDSEVLVTSEDEPECQAYWYRDGHYVSVRDLDPHRA